MTIDVLGVGAVANAVGSIADAAKGIIAHFFPDKTEEEKAKLALAMQDMMNQYNLVNGQLEINKIEAASTNWFVAGWRPYIGWICGTGLGYQFLFMPITNGIIKLFTDTVPFVALDTPTLVACLSGLLGLGSLRTYEKKTGAEGNR